MNIGVVLSGGVGVRFGCELAKQYQSICGKEIIGYVVEAMKKSSEIEKIIVVAGKVDMDRLQATYDVECAVAGDTHNASVKSSLDFIHKNYPACKKILFSDAARPFLDAVTINRYFKFLDEFDGVITARHITDSLGYEGESFTDRSKYFLIQKPEAFRFDLLNRYFSGESCTTAIVQQLPQGANIKKYFDIKQNLKITYYEDLFLAEYLMRMRLKEEKV